MTSSGIFIMKFLLLMVMIQIVSRKNAENCSTYLSIVLMTAMISLTGLLIGLRMTEEIYPGYACDAFSEMLTEEEKYILNP